LEPDLHTTVDFYKTYAPQPHSPSSSAPATRSIGRVGRRSLAHGLHAPKSFSLFGPCDSHAPPFQAMLDGSWGLRRPICGWVLPIIMCVQYTPPFLTMLVSAPLPTACFWMFSTLCVCIFLLFLQSQFICVLLKFYLNICWLVARLALFYF
jgi:hypothetical protein